MGNEKTSRLEELIEKWNTVYEMTNKRKHLLEKKIEGRESRRKTLSQCAVTLSRARELSSKDFKECLSEVESMKIALAEFESCETTLKNLQSETSSIDNELGSPENNQQEIASYINQCKEVRMSLSNKLEKLETILEQQSQFNAEFSKLMEWIASTKGVLVKDFYSLAEEQRHSAALEQETLAKEFSAKKETVENLVRVGRELKSTHSEEYREEVAEKLSELSENWRELERIFASQEEHVEECLREHQNYYDAVEQLWDWIQEIGQRMNIQMEKPESNSEQELMEYLSMLTEMKESSLLFDKVLKSGEKLSARLDEEEGGEIQEQLERLKSEWEMLRSQVVERLKELKEIMGEDAWLKVGEISEATLEELKSLGIVDENCDIGSNASCFARGMDSSAEAVNRDSVLNLDEDNLGVKKGNTREAALHTKTSVDLLPEEAVLSRGPNDFEIPNSVKPEILADETELYGALSTGQSVEKTDLKNLDHTSDSNIEQKESSQDTQHFSVPSLILDSMPEINANESDDDYCNKVDSDEMAVNALDGNNKYQDIPDQSSAQILTSVDSNDNIIDIPRETGRTNEEVHPDSFVQILVLPVEDSENTIDSPEETSSTNEKYPRTSIQILSNNENGCYREVVDPEPLKGRESDLLTLVQMSPQASNVSIMDSSAQDHGCPEIVGENTTDNITQTSTEMNESNESSAKYVDVEATEDGLYSEKADHEPLEKSASDQVVVFMNRIKDSEEFLGLIEARIEHLSDEESSEFLAEFTNRDPEFESVLETGMNLVRDIPEDKQFAVEEKIIMVEEKWVILKEKLIKRKAAAETASLLKNRLQQCEEFVKEVSDFVSSNETNPEWLFTDEETGSIVECYLGRLEREQVALKGLVEGTKDTLAIVPGKTGEEIEEKMSRVSKDQSELAQKLFEKKTMLERWFKFSLILEGVEHEVEAMTEEFKDLMDGEETFIMESHLSESRVHMLKILLGSLKGKAITLSELSTEYKDVLSFSNDCDKKFRTHEQNVSAKIALVADRLEKLESYLESFKELENETNELQVEVQQADEALSTFGEGLAQFDEVDSKGSRLERLSEIIHLEDSILNLEPRVKLVKEKSLEQLDKLDYENSGYWFQENVQCLVSRYERARTRAQKNLESIEFRVSLKDEFQVRLLEITSFLGMVEEYLNEDEEIPRNFDVTAKEVALLNGKRFLEEMESKEGDLCDLMEVSLKLSQVERSDTWKEEVLQLRERFNIRLKELRKNVSCLDETLNCFNDFEQKVEELSSLMFEAQGFLYGEGVATKGLEDLLEVGRSCLKNVQQKEVTLLELKNRVERLTESFNEEDKDIIITELLDLEKKLSALKMKVIERISSLEALGSRHDVYRTEANVVRNEISSLKKKIKGSDGKMGVVSGPRKDILPEESLSRQISDESLSEKLPDESFSQKLEELRTRLQNLDQMKTDLEEESQETNVNLGTLLGLEPLELTFADLERIDQEKTNELRKYKEKQQVILAKVSKFEEKFKQLQTQFEENKAHPMIVSETVAKTNNLLQEVESTLVVVDSVEKLTDERRKMVNRLETIRNDCVEMQKRLVRLDKSVKQVSEDRNNIASVKSVDDSSVNLDNDYQPTPQLSNLKHAATSDEMALPSSSTSQQYDSTAGQFSGGFCPGKDDTVKYQGNAGAEAIPNEKQHSPCNVSPANSPTKTVSSDSVASGGLSESHLPGFSQSGDVHPNELPANELDERLVECLSEGETCESKSIIVDDFEILQHTIEELANDEEILEMMISNSEYTSENLYQELEATKEKLKLLQRKETFLDNITSKAVDMLDTVSAKEQAEYQDSIVEIEEKFSTAEECLLTRIEMLEQCVQTNAKLKENILECYKILETVEDVQNDDIEMVKEYIEVLSDPNSCLENANRLNFALSVVGDFEEAVNTKQEIDDLEERWEKALEYLEQQVKESYVMGCSKENVSSIQNDCIGQESETDSEQNLVQQEDKQLSELESPRVENNTSLLSENKGGNGIAPQERSGTNFVKARLEERGQQEMDEVMEFGYVSEDSSLMSEKNIDSDFQEECDNDTDSLEDMAEHEMGSVSGKTFIVDLSKDSLIGQGEEDVDSGNDIEIQQGKVVEMEDVNEDTFSMLNKYKRNDFENGENYSDFEVDTTEQQVKSDTELKQVGEDVSLMVVQQRFESEDQNVSSTLNIYKDNHHEAECENDVGPTSEDTAKQLKDLESVREETSSTLNEYKDNGMELESGDCKVEDIAEQEVTGMESVNVDPSSMLNQYEENFVEKEFTQYEEKEHVKEDDEKKSLNKDDSNVNDSDEQDVESDVDTKNIVDDVEPTPAIEGEGCPREMNWEKVSDLCHCNRTAIDVHETLFEDALHEQNVIDKISKGKSSNTDENEATLAYEICNISEENDTKDDESQKGFVTRNRTLSEEEENSIDQNFVMPGTSVGKLERSDNSEEEEYIDSEISKGSIDINSETQSINEYAPATVRTSDLNINKVGSIDNIGGTSKEISRNDYITKEISQKDVNPQSVEVEEQNVVEGSTAEMDSLDVYKRQAAPSKNVPYSLEEFIVTEIPQKVVVEKSRAQLEDENAVKSAEDVGTTRVHENQITSMDNMPNTEDNNPVKDLTPNDVVVTKLTTPVDGEQNVVMEIDTSIASKSRATSVNQIHVVSEECIVREAPRENVVIRNSALPKEQEENKVHVEVAIKDVNGDGQCVRANNWEVGGNVCLERSENSAIDGPETLIDNDMLPQNVVDGESKGKRSGVDRNDITLADENCDISKEISRGPVKMSQQSFVPRHKVLSEEQENSAELTGKKNETNNNSEKDIASEISQESTDMHSKTDSVKENVIEEASATVRTSDLEHSGVNSTDSTVEDDAIDIPEKFIDNVTHQQNVMDTISKDKSSSIRENNIISADEICDISKEINAGNDEQMSQEDVVTRNRTLSKEEENSVEENFVARGTSGKTSETTLLDNINGNSEECIVSELTLESIDANSEDDVIKESFNQGDVTEPTKTEAAEKDMPKCEVKYNTSIQLGDAILYNESQEEMTQKETSTKTNQEVSQNNIIKEEVSPVGITQAQFAHDNIIPLEIIQRHVDQGSSTQGECSQDTVIPEEADKSDKTKKNEVSEEQVEEVNFDEDNHNGIESQANVIEESNDQSEIAQDEVVYDIKNNHEGETQEYVLHVTSDASHSQEGIVDKMLQNNEIPVQRESNLLETNRNKNQETVDFNLIDSTVPSFCVASEDDTCKESNILKLEDAYCTMNTVSTELAKIKNVDHRQKITPQTLLEYELRSLNKLRSIEMQLQSVASEDINLDTVEKDKKTLLSNLVKEQQLEIERIRNVLNNRVRKIESFFAIKTRMKSRIEEISVILKKTTTQSSLKDRVEKMEQLLNMDEGLSRDFANCLDSLSSEYPSLDLTYAEQIHEHYNMKRSEVMALLDVAKKQLNVKRDIEEELNDCAEWLFANEEKIIEVNDGNDDVGPLEEAVENVDEFLVGLEDRIQRLRSYSVSESAVLNILPAQERIALLSKVKDLEERLKKTQAFVEETKQDLKVKIETARRKEKISACQSWCKRTNELLYCNNNSSQCLFRELSDLVNEGKTFIENIKTEQEYVSDKESCDMVEFANELLQTAKEKLQGISEKDKTLEKLSCEVSEIERRVLVQFDNQSKSIDNEECLKSQEEIQNAQNRLQNISNEIKSVFPDLGTYPANSRENELLRKSEYLLKEINELTEKRLSRETLADCENSLEQVKDVCSKPMMFGLDVVKMKKELAELGKISLELKEKEARLQQVNCNLSSFIYTMKF